ncbi:hypothetical protein [Jiella mangrovi]|uniref:SMODS and SLOG-associating 2TM effector domain-containing protein n=1 Tax=Jiella mangrovi TaxID=2821407 RepID=A0ABS4BMD7_9HYPH|nr:hypothetical protein [Jiella mangrovi]MBP0617845.1 hypothetical protein [Jiella mangrovi]
MSELSSIEKTRMRAMRNGVYHSMRRQFFERCERFANLSVLLLGAASVAQVAAKTFGDDMPSLIFGFLVALVGGLQLVFNFGGRARDHAMFQARFYGLMAKTERSGDDPERLAAEIESEMATFYGEEPPTYHIVNAIAYNAVQDSFGRPDKSALFKIGTKENLLKDFFHYSPHDLKTFGEIDAERERHDGNPATA